jgi:hypothetical protein
MIREILLLMGLLFFILVISFINGIRYILLKRKLKLMYIEHREEIQKAIGSDRIKISSLIKEPFETGNIMLDLLLFKLHRSVKLCILWLFFYPIAVISVYFLLRL